jgi:hypothetical protein
MRVYRRKRPRPPSGAPDHADFVEAGIRTPSFQSLRTLSSLWRPQRAVKGRALDRALGRPPLRESVSRSNRPREVDVTSSHHLFVCRTVPSAFIAGGYTTGSSLRAPKPNCVCLWEHPKRMRGRCLLSDCHCLKYVPLTDRRRPVNRRIGRARR